MSRRRNTGHSGRDLGYGVPNGRMLRSELASIRRSATSLQNAIRAEDQVPSWVLTKAAVALSKLQTAENYIISKLNGMNRNPAYQQNKSEKAKGFASKVKGAAKAFGRGAKKAGKAAAHMTKISTLKAKILSEKNYIGNLKKYGRDLEVSDSAVKATKAYKNSKDRISSYEDRIKELDKAYKASKSNPRRRNKKKRAGCRDKGNKFIPTTACLGTRAPHAEAMAIMHSEGISLAAAWKKQKKTSTAKKKVADYKKSQKKKTKVADTFTTKFDESGQGLLFNPRNNPMKKALQNRIALANKYIKFAMKHDIWGQETGAEWSSVMQFTHLITVSPKGRTVTIKFRQPYGFTGEKGVNGEFFSETFYLNRFDAEQEIKAIIRGIIAGIKKGAKEEGWTIGHTGQKVSARKSNPRRRNFVSSHKKAQSYNLKGYFPSKKVLLQAEDILDNIAFGNHNWSEHRSSGNFEYSFSPAKVKRAEKVIAQFGGRVVSKVAYDDSGNEVMPPDRSNPRRRKNSYHGRKGKPINPHSERWTLTTFSEKYFGKDYKSIPMPVRKEFWNDFQYEFEEPINIYMRMTYQSGELEKALKAYKNLRRRKNTSDPKFTKANLKKMLTKANKAKAGLVIYSTGGGVSDLVASAFSSNFVRQASANPKRFELMYQNAKMQVDNEKDFFRSSYKRSPMPTFHIRLDKQINPRRRKNAGHETHFTKEEINTISFVGNRYGWSSSLLDAMTYNDDGSGQVSYRDYYEIQQGIESDMEGGHNAFPMLNTRSGTGSDLADKLVAIYNSEI